jgi:hypothetical protein
MWLVFGLFFGVLSSTTSQTACLRGGPSTPAVWRSSVASSQVILSPTRELLATTGSFDAMKMEVVMDLIVFLIFFIGSYL